MLSAKGKKKAFHVSDFQIICHHCTMVFVRVFLWNIWKSWTHKDVATLSMASPDWQEYPPATSAVMHTMCHGPIYISYMHRGRQGSDVKAPSPAPQWHQYSKNWLAPNSILTGASFLNTTLELLTQLHLWGLMQLRKADSAHKQVQYRIHEVWSFNPSYTLF